jgi:hypothetical protein
MSYKNANLYASRVFAEHPIALWSLDEDYLFLSLVPESDKKITNSTWSISGGQYSTSTTFPENAPIIGDYTSKFFIPVSSSSQYIDIVGDPIVYEDFIDESKGSICFSLNVFAPVGKNVATYDIGFIVGGQRHYLNHTVESEGSWQKISYTKQITSTENLTPFIKINYSDNLQTGEVNSPVFINGLSVGQWSEPYNHKNTGVFSEELPESLTSLLPYAGFLKGLKLDAYGFNDLDDAYIIQERKRLLAEKANVPMVYGSKNNVSIFSKNPLNVFEDFIDGESPETLIFFNYVDGSPIYYEESLEGGSSLDLEEESLDGGSSILIEEEFLDGGESSPYFEDSIYGGDETYLNEDILLPSIIFPGKGFLNNSGKYTNLTAEFWLRINNESVSSVKIFGPLTSDDGIYVESSFITIKVGKHVKSYFIGSWYRPMLVHFSQSPNEISLMVNGEKVISIPVDLEFLESLTSESEDFLGFFGDNKISIFEIDCFSIFPYIVSEQIAKRRYVYGQGVEDQDSLLENINGDLHQIDFPFSGYGSTISYPDRTQWDSGYFNNLKVDSSGLSLIDYNLPEVLFNYVSSSATVTQLESENFLSSFEIDNFLIQDEEYPFLSMSPSASYSNYYGTLYFSKLNQLDHPTSSVYGIFKAPQGISQEQTILYFENSRNNDYFKVALSSGSLQYIYNGSVLTKTPVASEEFFAVGFDIDKLSTTYSSQIKNFFSNTETISLNVAGYGQSKFYGKMFSLTINNRFYTEKDSLFNEFGIAEKAFTGDKFSYVGSYTLVPKISNSTVYLDIASSGYWESSIPLSYFGKYVIDSKGNRVYDLDLIQFNIDAPTSPFFIGDQISTDFQNSSPVKTYITLQEKTNVGMVPYTDYALTRLISQENKILNFDQESNLETTKFLVSDGTIVFPPDFIGNFSDYYMGIHIELKSNGTKTENLKVKRMSFASLSFDESQFFGINTTGGRKVYPIVKTQDQYVYDQKNPVIIDIESSPYLYLTKNSGIHVAPYLEESGLERGLSFPINPELRSEFTAAGIQMFLMFDKERIFSSRQLLGRIISSDRSVDIVLIPEEDQKRASLKFFDTFTQNEETGFKAFLNGRFSDNILIRPLEWNVLTVSFESNSFELNSRIAQLEIYSGIVINNVAIFKKSTEVSSISESSNEWINILRDLDVYGAAQPEFAWQYWDSLNSGSASWVDVLNFQRNTSVKITINGEGIFGSYTGLSSVVSDDNSMLNVNFDSIRLFNDVTWDTFVTKPV